MRLEYGPERLKQKAITEGIFGGAKAAKKAGKVQFQAAQQAIGEQRSQFKQTREDLAQFREAGLPALSQFQALLGFGDPGSQEAAQAALAETPGQQFIRKRAQRNLLQNASAIGGLGGGNVRSALVEQGAGFGAQDLQNQFARLQALVTGGQNASAQTGQFGQLAASNIGNLLQQGGQARASGILGAQQANAGLVNNIARVGGFALGGGFTGGKALNLFSDERVKYDVKEMTPEECMQAVMTMDIKAWRYLPRFDLGDDVHFGVMAQEAPECIRAGNLDGYEALNLHDELSLIAGALKYLMEGGKKCLH